MWTMDSLTTTTIRCKYVVCSLHRWQGSWWLLLLRVYVCECCKKNHAKDLWWEETINMVLISRRSVSFLLLARFFFFYTRFFFLSSIILLPWHFICFHLRRWQLQQQKQKQQHHHQQQKQHRSFAQLKLHFQCKCISLSFGYARGNNYACKRFPLASLPTSAAIFNLLWVHTSYSSECHFSFCFRSRSLSCWKVHASKWSVFMCVYLARFLIPRSRHSMSHARFDAFSLYHNFFLFSSQYMSL